MSGGEPRHRPGAELVSIRVAGQLFALDIMQVREIRGWTESTALPHAPDYVLGMINLRGQILPVLDLAARLGLGRQTPGAASVVIVADLPRQAVGLLADEVCDIIVLEEGMLQAAPEVGEAQLLRFVEGVITLGEEIGLLLGLERILDAGAEGALAA